MDGGGVPSPDHLTATIALELARTSARVALCVPLDDAIDAALKEAQALGRHVAWIDPLTLSREFTLSEVEGKGEPVGSHEAIRAVQQTLETFARLDALVNLGQRGAHLAHAARPYLETIVNVVPSEAWDRFKPDELRKALYIEGIRANAIGITEHTAPQEVARLAIFLASDAGRYLTGQCIPSTPPPPSHHSVVPPT